MQWPHILGPQVADAGLYVVFNTRAHDIRMLPSSEDISLKVLICQLGDSPSILLGFKFRQSFPFTFLLLASNVMAESNPCGKFLNCTPGIS